MRHWFFRTACFVSFGLLAACTTTAPKVPISPQAEAALPEGTEIGEVRRLSNGCYFIVKQIGTRTVSQPLTGPDGLQVCDEVPLEEMLSPDRVVVNERAL